MPVRYVAFILAAALALESAFAEIFSGDGTYYGENGWEGSCKGNLRWASGEYDTTAWPPSSGIFGTRVALNNDQYSTAMCGKKLMFRGTGEGLGHSPISTDWQEGMVTNHCPECVQGDLDLGINGDGRWKIEWYWIEDNISAGLTTEAGSVQRVFSQPKSKVVKSAPKWKRVFNRLKKDGSAAAKARRKFLYRHSLAVKAKGGRRLLKTVGQ